VPEGNAFIQQLDLPSLQTATAIDPIGNSALTKISAPGLTSASRIDIERNVALPTCLAQNRAAQANATNVTISGNDGNATCP
jgi:hypothetical protein